MSVFEIQFKRMWLKRFIAFGVGYAVIVGIWCGGFHGYLSSRLGEDHGALYSLLIAVVLAVILIVKFRLWRIVTDRSFSGEITHISYKETLTSPKCDSRPTATVPRYHIYITVRKTSGKMFTKHIEHEDPFHDGLWYSVGDTVIYHRGTKFPLVKDGRRICAYCGHQYIREDTKCTNCGYRNEF